MSADLLRGRTEGRVAEGCRVSAAASMLSDRRVPRLLEGVVGQVQERWLRAPPLRIFARLMPIEHSLMLPSSEGAGMVEPTCAARCAGSTHWKMIGVEASASRVRSESRPSRAMMKW